MQESHQEGFKKLGFDPKKPDNNNWEILLPFFKKALDKADSIETKILSDGKVYYYTKNFADKGVKILVKIFQYKDGSMVPSDAWPVY